MHAFDVLGDPVRRHTLEVLADGERTSGAVTEVVRAEFALSQPAVSQHLRVLRESGSASVRTVLAAAGVHPGPRVPTRPIRRRKEHDVKDVLDELAAARRRMGAATLPAGDAYTVELRRRYDAPVDDVWDAITDPERLGRWLTPVTGDLRPGGSFELDGGEHGEILVCDPPRRLRVSWLFGPDADEWPGTSEVEVRLSPGAAGDTELELVHAAAVGEPMFPTYGPGAGGVGWDLHLLALARFLVDGGTLDHEEFRTAAEGREFARRSAAAWGGAHLAAGGDPDRVAAAVQATTAFYVPGGDTR